MHLLVDHAEKDKIMGTSHQSNSKPCPWCLNPDPSSLTSTPTLFAQASPSKWGRRNAAVQEKLVEMAGEIYLKNAIENRGLKKQKYKFSLNLEISKILFG